MAEQLSPALPPQEDVEDTYMDPLECMISSILVNRIRSTSPVSEIVEAWQPILVPLFTMNEGYIVRSYRQLGPGRETAKVSVKRNKRYADFLNIEFKPPSYPTSGPEFMEARFQIGATIRWSKTTKADMIWCILCIGKNVQFCKATKQRMMNPRLEPLHDGMLRIDRHPITVTDLLLSIRSQVEELK
ncbi:hypothetical protein NM208_g4880 [Fusarium decemcellulare]|uniref:Uncharacterized protein n=1 Tax=Fusarium decemcellulare TaxID=57161 RepID=A0ACC1SJ75_9HYPO|nr:hypothetical protein NM208_g4880 [Fusarium decemcellulare]